MFAIIDFSPDIVGNVPYAVLYNCNVLKKINK